MPKLNQEYVSYILSQIRGMQIRFIAKKILRFALFYIKWNIVIYYTPNILRPDTKTELWAISRDCIPSWTASLQKVSL